MKIPQNKMVSRVFMPKKKRGKFARGKRTTERLSHFSCGVCKKWWSIGDAPMAKKQWFCAWCGKPQQYK